ncbi:hypothetical protein DUI70_2922 [Streptomyces albus]|nr:hypothetical protein DUI70_2922 [Streptomyces albus]
MINIWTTNWTWPAGAGLGTLLLIQALVEWSRARATEDGPSSSSPSRRRVVQHFADISDSSITAARGLGEGGDVEVRQSLGEVSRSTVIGLDGNNNQ